MVCSVNTLWSDGNAVADRAAQYLLHGVLVALFHVQVTVFLIAFQDSFALQKPGNPVADRMHQLRQFLLVGCMGTMKATFTTGCSGVNTIQKQYVTNRQKSRFARPQVARRVAHRDVRHESEH